VSDKAEKATDYLLPPTLIGHADVARLIREIESVDSELQAQKVRGGQEVHLPAVSQSMADFAELNKLDMTDDRALTTLRSWLQQLKDHAPVVHMTFATEADPESLQKVVGWLREQAHPQTLLSVGLQPALVMGAYLRTPNHVHDFTVRALLKNRRDIIVGELERLNAG
jgi:G3E family GTPase